MRQGPETGAGVCWRSGGRSDPHEARRLRLLAAAAQCRRPLRVRSEGRRGCCGLCMAGCRGGGSQPCWNGSIDSSTARACGGGGGSACTAGASGPRDRSRPIPEGGGGRAAARRTEMRQGRQPESAAALAKARLFSRKAGSGWRRRGRRRPWRLRRRAARRRVKRCRRAAWVGCSSASGGRGGGADAQHGRAAACGCAVRMHCQGERAARA